VTTTDAEQPGPLKARDRKERLVTVVVYTGFGLYMLFFLVVAAVLPGWALWVWLIVGAAAIVLGATRLAPQTRELIKNQCWQAFARLMVFCLSILLASFPYAAVRWVSEQQLLAVRLAGLGVFSLALAWAVFAISTKQQRQRLVAKGLAVTLLYAVTVAVVAAGTFSAITMELVDRGMVALDPTPENRGQLTDFFMWHLINAAPGSIPSTLRWEPPFDYDQTRVGALILLFTLAVATPVVAIGRETLLHWRESASSDDG
jgi:hypothetical protein